MFVSALLRIAIFVLLGRAALLAELSVPRWEPHDFAFRISGAPENPFAATFSAEVRGPGGIAFELPGFFDGDGTWKLRIAPTQEGRWSLLTHSTVSELDGRREDFVCAPNPSPGAHGALRVDPQYRHHFVFEDGSRFLPVGYECDWLWALDAGDPALPTVNAFLDRLAASGFNLVVLNAYAHDTSWRKGRTAADDFGPPALYPWGGSNAAPDFTRFDLAYWRHYDRIVEALHRRGLWAHLLIKVYNKQVNWPAKGSAEEDRYFRWLIARYAAFPNLSWDLAKEAQYEKDTGYKLARLQFLRANDPYRRLLTVHDDRVLYDQGAYAGVVDYRSDQQHKEWHATMLDHLRQQDWPVINTEFGYEHGPAGPADKTYSQAQSPEEVARRAWEVYASGGFGVYYYTHTAWDVVRAMDEPPGYRYIKNLRTFFEATNYWRLRPAEGVASVGFCLAEPGREYVVFVNVAASVALKIEGATAPLVAEWYRPYTAERRAAGKLENGTATLPPPPEWGSEPIALHLRPSLAAK